jgi:dolichyl-phosphate-mannose--protein O-mannosyl transferase
MAPFLIMGLALCSGDILAAGRRARRNGYEWKIISVVGVSIYLGLVVLNFMWMWPILTGEPISREMWNMQIWLPSWS